MGLGILAGITFCVELYKVIKQKYFSAPEPELPQYPLPELVDSMTDSRVYRGVLGSQYPIEEPG